MTDTPPPKIAFDSPEEFAALCRAISGRMHYLNRVALGEQRFAWEVADMLARLGDGFRDHHKDPEVRKLFGDGWEPGTVSRADAPQALHDLIYRDKPG